MNTFKSSEPTITPRRILNNISNITLPSRAASSNYHENTRLQTELSSPAARTAPSARDALGPDVFITQRKSSKTYRNLTKLRPRTPPSPIQTSDADGLHLPHGDYVDDTQNLYSQNYNRCGRGIIEADGPIHDGRKASVSARNAHDEGSLNVPTSLYHMDSPLSTLRRRHAVATFPNLETQRIRLHGLTNSGYTSALDLYRPVLQSYSPGNLRQAANGAGMDYLRTGPLVEHLDVCTVLKGLSLADAEVMFSIDSVFQKSLEEVLASQLQQMEWQARRELPPYHIDNSDGPVAPVASRQLSFRLAKLVKKMVKGMQQEGPGRDELWPTSSLLVYVMQYLTTRDCLIDIEPCGFQDMAVQIRMHYAGIPRPMAEVIRNPDFLCFERLDPLPREGQQFRVIPRYRHGAFYGIEDASTTIEYVIEPAVPWLTWKPELRGFVGIIPLFSEMASGTALATRSVICMGSVSTYTDVHYLRFEVKAILTEKLIPMVRLERTIRTRLNIKVIPWYAHSSALAPKGSSSDSLILDQNAAAALSPRVNSEAITTGVAKCANKEALGPSKFASPKVKPDITASMSEERQFSQSQKRHSPWPICDLSNYDIKSIFAEHKPYHKSTLIPGSPRKHVDEVFGLHVAEDIDSGGGAVTDVQVYRITSLDPVCRYRPGSILRHSSCTESEVAEIPTTTQHIENLANATSVSRNSLPPFPVEEDDVSHVVALWGDQGGSPRTLPTSGRSLELAPASGTPTYTSIGRNHNGQRARHTFPLYDEEAERQERLHFPRSEMRKKDQTRWLDASISRTRRSRPESVSDDTDAADLDYEEFLRPPAEAYPDNGTDNQPGSGLNSEVESYSAATLVHAALDLEPVHPMWRTDDYKSEREQNTQSSTDAARANFPVALKLWAYRSTRRANDRKRRAGSSLRVRNEMKQPRASRTSEDIDRFADFRFNFDSSTTIHREAEDVDHFADFRPIFDYNSAVNRAAELTDYFADYTSIDDRTGSNRAVKEIDYFADFRTVFEDRAVIDWATAKFDSFAELRRFIDHGPRYDRTAELVDHFAQSRWIFGCGPNVNGEDELPTDYFADFRSAFDDRTHIDCAIEEFDYFAGFRKLIDDGPGYGCAADAVDHFAQFRWIFDSGPKIGKLGGGAELSTNYFQEFGSVFEDSIGAARFDEFAEFWSLSDDEDTKISDAAEDADYFADLRSIFDGDSSIEGADELFLDPKVASESGSPPTSSRTPKLPRITCFFNRYSPLRKMSNANIDVLSDISDEEHRETVDHFQELPNLSPADYLSAPLVASSWPAPSSSGQLHRPGLQRKMDSGCYEAFDGSDDHADYRADGVHLWRENRSSAAPRIRLFTPPIEVLAPLDYRKPRNRVSSNAGARSASSSSDGLVVEAGPSTFQESRNVSTFTDSRVVSDALEIIVENEDVDPRLRREQAMLWSVLATREFRLAREETKALFEAMKMEAQEEERRVERGLEALELNGDDFEFGPAADGEESDGEAVAGNDAETVVGSDC